MIGTKFLGFIVISSMTGLAYLKYSQIDGFNKKVAELQKNNQLSKYLFQAFEQSSYFVDDLMTTFERGFNSAHIANYKRTLLQFAEGKVLQTCAGSNRNLKYYPIGISLTLLDWSPNMVSIGSSKTIPTLSYDYLIGDVTKMKFPDNHFDTVVDIFGLDCVMEPQKALEEMRRVCKKDGRILLMNHGLSDIVEFHYWQNAVSGQKLINMGMFSNRNWQKILKEFDFEIEHSERKKNGKLYIYVIKNSKTGKAGEQMVTQKDK